MAVDLNLNSYKAFVKTFRGELGVGLPAKRVAGAVEVNCAPNSYRYNIMDLYLTHIRVGAADWRPLQRHNYAQMGVDESYEIKGSRIKAAFQQSPPIGQNLMMVILATAEAARSQVVYQIVQQLLQNAERRLTWGVLKPLLIGSWILNTEENHKRRPIHFGALRASDYYNDEAVQAIKAIVKLGFLLE